MFPDFVKTAEIPGDIYFQAGLRVAEYSSQLALHNIPSCLHGDEYPSDSNILWSGTDKEYLDYLVQEDTSRSGATKWLRPKPGRTRLS